MDGVRDDGARGHKGAIQIALWLDGSTPAGVATASGGAALDFTGWVGLMSAVDALAESEPGTLDEEDAQ